MNLRAMQTMAAAFGRPVGFSDHSEGIELPLVAIAMGAVVIEKHLTLDRTMEGGDHKASLEPDDFTRMVNRIRALEEALGDGVKRCHAAEANVRLVARKSLVARTPIAQGQPIATLVVSVPDRAPVEVPLVAGIAVESLGLMGRLSAALKYILWGESG